MEIMSEKILGAAEDESRFETHDAESHRIWTFEKAPTSYDWTPIGYAGKHLTSLSWSELASPANPPAPASYSSSDSGITGSLHAIFQTSRPEHVSGRPDILPFSDKSTCKQVFSALKLPLAYLMIADGALGISHSHIIRDAFDRPIRFDFIVHCASKQGDWSMALSHSVATRDTSAFLSIELDMDKPPIVDALRTWQDYAFHPAYLPCIMFADMLRKSVKRRFQIKTRIRALEETLRTVTKAAQRAPGPEYENFDRMLEEPQRIETLFDLLHGCRKDQSSREGRYELWSTYYGAIHESLCYAENAIKWVEPEHFRKIHSDLRQWSQLTWRKFESLKARDKDHIARVDNLSAMVCVIFMLIRRAPY